MIADQLDQELRCAACGRPVHEGTLHICVFELRQWRALLRKSERRERIKRCVENRRGREH